MLSPPAARPVAQRAPLRVSPLHRGSVPVQCGSVAARVLLSQHALLCAVASQRCLCQQRNIATFVCRVVAAALVALQHHVVRELACHVRLAAVLQQRVLLALVGQLALSILTRRQRLHTLLALLKHVLP